MKTTQFAHVLLSFLQGQLYVVGGTDNQAAVMSCERLNLTLPMHEWAWQDVDTPLDTWHSAGAIVALMRDEGTDLAVLSGYGELE